MAGESSSVHAEYGWKLSGTSTDVDESELAAHRATPLTRCRENAACTASPPTPLCGWQPVCTDPASTCRHEQRPRRVPVCAGRPRHARAGARGVHQRLCAVYYLSWEKVRLIAADTKLADRTAAQHAPSPADTAAPTASDTAAPKAPASKGKSSPAPHDSASPAALTQLRSELAATQKTRASLEASLSTLTATVATLQLADSQQKQRIAHLEKHRAHQGQAGGA